MNMVTCFEEKYKNSFAPIYGWRDPDAGVAVVTFFILFALCFTVWIYLIGDKLYNNTYRNYLRTKRSSILHGSHGYDVNKCNICYPYWDTPLQIDYGNKIIIMILIMPILTMSRK